MAGNFFKQFGSAIIGLLVIAYVGLQLALNVGDMVEVENVTYTSAELAYDVTAYIFRNETVVYPSASGVNCYMADEGEKVAKGQSLAMTYTESSSAAVQERINELNDKIELLEASRGQSASTSAELARLDASISDGILGLIGSLEANEPDAALRGDEQLLVLMNRRKSLTMTVDSFELKISQYKDEIAALESTLGIGLSSDAPESGYFYQSADGYESSFTLEAMENLSPESFQSLISAPPADVSGALGRMSPSARWYIAFSIDKRTAAEITSGKASTDTYPFEFAYSGGIRLEFTHYKTVSRTDSDTAVMVFTTNELPDGFDFSRIQPVRLVSTVYTGLRVPVAALRMVDGKTGVYTLDGTVVHFKETTVLFEDEGIYICELPVVNSKPAVLSDRLSLYDPIIVSGRDIYEGKILS